MECLQPPAPSCFTLPSVIGLPTSLDHRCRRHLAKASAHRGGVTGASKGAPKSSRHTSGQLVYDAAALGRFKVLQAVEGGPTFVDDGEADLATRAGSETAVGSMAADATARAALSISRRSMSSRLGPERPSLSGLPPKMPRGIDNASAKSIRTTGSRKWFCSIREMVACE